MGMISTLLTDEEETRVRKFIAWSGMTISTLVRKGITKVLDEHYDYYAKKESS